MIINNIFRMNLIVKKGYLKPLNIRKYLLEVVLKERSVKIFNVNLFQFRVSNSLAFCEPSQEFNLFNIFAFPR